MNRLRSLTKNQRDAVSDFLVAVRIVETKNDDCLGYP